MMLREASRKGICLSAVFFLSGTWVSCHDQHDGSTKLSAKKSEQAMVKGSTDAGSSVRAVEATSESTTVSAQCLWEAEQKSGSQAKPNWSLLEGEACCEMEKDNQREILARISAAPGSLIGVNCRELASEDQPGPNKIAATTEKVVESNNKGVRLNKKRAEPVDTVASLGDKVTQSDDKSSESSETLASLSDEATLPNDKSKKPRDRVAALNDKVSASSKGREAKSKKSDEEPSRQSLRARTHKKTHTRAESIQKRKAKQAEGARLDLALPITAADQSENNPEAVAMMNYHEGVSEENDESVLNNLVDFVTGHDRKLEKEQHSVENLLLASNLNAQKNAGSKCYVAPVNCANGIQQYTLACVAPKGKTPSRQIRTKALRKFDNQQSDPFYPLPECIVPSVSENLEVVQGDACRDVPFDSDGCQVVSR